MKWDSLSRRHFLQGAGATLALPLLPSLMSREARAQAAPVQKSFIGIAAYNGLYRMIGPYSQLMPPLPYDITSTAGFTPLSPPGLHTLYSRPLSTLVSNGQISDIIDASFNAMLPKMLMMQGFDFLPFYAHHHAHFGNGAASSDFESVSPMASLDQVLASSTSFYKTAALKGRSLAYTANDAEAGGPLGSLYPGGLASSATYQDPTHPTNGGIIPTARSCNPQAVWDHFFSSGAQSGPSLKATMVDRVLQDYKAVRNGKTIGSADAQILDQHVAFLQTAEQQVQATSGCTPGVRPPTHAPSGAAWGAGL
ncbi:MAG TPA: DUF1552 domain-containing protein, partial [Gemmatimonadales bacterium]|nr:DUF1552 domain-containing protein [Gemmatimonadales bacterium]